MDSGNLTMKLFKVVLTSEIVVIANDEADAMRKAERCQRDVAGNDEFEAESSEPLLHVKDVPPGWDKGAIPWNGSESIEKILER